MSVHHQGFVESARGLAAVRAGVVWPGDPLALESALAAAAAGLILPVLIGDAAALRALSRSAGLDCNACQIVHAPDSREAAAKAAALAASGELAFLMKGSLHSDELLHAIAQPGSGLRTRRRLTHAYVMDLPSYPRPLIISDAVVNIVPSLDEKAEIVQNAVDLAIALDIHEVRVALLSAVESVNPKIVSTVDAAALCKMADRGQLRGALLDGPLALDDAVSPEAAREKGIRSEVAGRANVLIVPDFESGNMLAKALILLARAKAAGVVLGARVPIALTSRADSVATHVASAAIARLLCRNAQVEAPNHEVISV